MKPSLRTWATAAAAVGSAAGAWIVVLTTLEGPFLDAVDPATQLTVGAVIAVAVGTFVWFLGRAVLRHESRRDVAFAEVLKEGNELVARRRKPKPE